MILTARILKADHVCAYVWIYSPPCYRRSLCALACIPEEQLTLDWYDLGETDRSALRPVVADIINANASRQHVEWSERVRRSAA